MRAAMATSHWADQYAERIIRQRGEKDLYVCASGITPSGTIHIGNFREVITVELVVRALRERGKEVRFIYSWDDYDVFRKVPANMPNKKMLGEHLRRPITLTPDPYGAEESYARHNEREMEELLPRVGIRPEYIYQASRYRAAEYADGIRLALEKSETLREILNEHRTSPLPDDWRPVLVFCGNCNRDTTEVTGWNGEWTLSYRCATCGYEEETDLRTTKVAKLPWRIDWPMRWAREGVDFEPAGKDHHSEGGSIDTGRKIATRVYGAEPPISFQYDFIGIKGGGGKISSSTGEVIGLRDVLAVYQPEIVRYMFAGTRPNSEFTISFDLDVLKIYEDYDRTERIHFGEEEVSEKRKDKESRIYELSQVDAVPDQMPFQVRFRHLCSLVQIHDGEIDSVLEALAEEAAGRSMDSLRTRAECALYWLENHAPESFRFSLRAPDAEPLELTPSERGAVREFYTKIVQKIDDFDETALSTAIYDLAHELEMEPKDLFQLIYRVVIGKTTGPRLAGFVLTVGKAKVMPRFYPYL
jgi:lysyl-tRNA synthetase class 1